MLDDTIMWKYVQNKTIEVSPGVAPDCNLETYQAIGKRERQTERDRERSTLGRLGWVERETAKDLENSQKLEFTGGNTE